MGSTVDAVLASLTALYTASAETAYGSAARDLPVDPLTGVSFLAHALQCAALAAAAAPDDEELTAAALLHDVGWLLPRPSEAALLTGGGSDAAWIARHDETGAAHLAAAGDHHTGRFQLELISTSS